MLGYNKCTVRYTANKCEWNATRGCARASPIAIRQQLVAEHRAGFFMRRCAPQTRLLPLREERVAPMMTMIIFMMAAIPSLHTSRSSSLTFVISHSLSRLLCSESSRLGKAYMFTANISVRDRPTSSSHVDEWTLFLGRTSAKFLHRSPTISIWPWSFSPYVSWVSCVCPLKLFEMMYSPLVCESIPFPSIHVYWRESFILSSCVEITMKTRRSVRGHGDDSVCLWDTKEKFDKRRWSRSSLDACGRIIGIITLLLAVIQVEDTTNTWSDIYLASLQWPALYTLLRNEHWGQWQVICPSGLSFPSVTFVWPNLIRSRIYYSTHYVDIIWIIFGKHSVAGFPYASAGIWAPVAIFRLSVTYSFFTRKHTFEAAFWRLLVRIYAILSYATSISSF